MSYIWTLNMSIDRYYVYVLEGAEYYEQEARRLRHRRGAVLAEARQLKKILGYHLVSGTTNTHACAEVRQRLADLDPREAVRPRRPSEPFRLAARLLLLYRAQQMQVPFLPFLREHCNVIGVKCTPAHAAFAQKNAGKAAALQREVSLLQEYAKNREQGAGAHQPK